MVPSYKKGCKEDPGNCKPVSPTPVPGKAMEQVKVQSHGMYKASGGSGKASQDEFRKGRSC